MATMWQKTMFYLGLVDEDQIQAAEEHAAAAVVQPQAAVRTVDSSMRPPVAPASTGPEIHPPVQRTRGTVAGRRVEPPDRSRRRMSSNPVHAEAGVLVTSSDGAGSNSSREMSDDAFAEVITASKFSDAQQLADYLRRDRPVVLDLRYTEPAMVRRLVDFSSGLTYALDGTMRKIGQGVILVSPTGANLSVQELRRLADMGLYQAGDVG